MYTRRLISITVAGITALMPGVAAAHPAANIAASSSAAIEVGTVSLLLLLAGGLYVGGVSRLWQRAGRGSGISMIEAASFSAGLVVIALALLTPFMGSMTERFSGHMVQHLLILVIATPLLVWGHPTLALVWAIRDTRARSIFDVTRKIRPSRFARIALTAPVILAAYVIVVWAWHMPALYDAAVRHEALHALEHTTMATVALLFWGRVRSLAVRGPQQQVFAAALLFAAMFPDLVLGAFLTFARSPLYEVHRIAAPGGLDPAADQQFGGLLMLMLGGMAYMGVALVLMLRLLNRPASSGLLRSDAGGGR